MSTKKNNGNENERWYKSENRLFHADIVTNKSTGAVVKMNNSLEKVYAYMLNQYRFREGLKQPFAEAQEHIGKVARIGDPKKNTKAYIDKLIALGLVEVANEKLGRCTIYKVNTVESVENNLEFTYPVWDDEPTYDHEKRLGKKSNKQQTEESKNDGKSESKEPNHGCEPNTPPVWESVKADTGESVRLQQPADHRVNVVPTHDSVNQEQADSKIEMLSWVDKPFEGNGKLRQEARQWAQSQGDTTWQDEIKSVWKMQGVCAGVDPSEAQRPDDIHTPAITNAPMRQQVNWGNDNLDSPF